MSDVSGLSAELRKADKKQQQKLRTLLYSLDWIKILDEAIKLRPSSWNSNPVREWRNASDCVNYAVVHALEEAQVLLTFKEETKK